MCASEWMSESVRVRCEWYGWFYVFYRTRTHSMHTDKMLSHIRMYLHRILVTFMFHQNGWYTNVCTRTHSSHSNFIVGRLKIPFVPIQRLYLCEIEVWKKRSKNQVKTSNETKTIQSSIFFLCSNRELDNQTNKKSNLNWRVLNFVAVRVFVCESILSNSIFLLFQLNSRMLIPLEHWSIRLQRPTETK